MHVSGTLRCFKRPTDPGQFDMALYYRQRGIDFALSGATLLETSQSFSAAGELIYSLRKAAEMSFDSLFDEEQAAILKAMILGDKDYLSKETKKLFENSGCSHLLCISGTHIGILGLALYSLLKRVSRSKAAAGISAALLMCLYGAVCGMGSATFRAIVMFVMCLAADVLGRTYDVFTALAAAAVAALAVNPVLIYDSGFVLSFGAAAGIAVLRDIPASLAVSVFTLPFMLHFYYQYPLYSLLLGAVLIPLMGVLLTGAILCIPIGIFFPLKALALPVSLLLNVYTGACRIASMLPGTVRITGKPGAARIALYYILLFLFTYISARHRALAKWKYAVYVLLTVLAAATPIFGMHMYMADVGQGDCILMYDSRACVLMDCGSLDESEVGEYRLIPMLESLGISRVDAIVVSHTDEDHISGIRELLVSASDEGIDIGEVFFGADAADMADTAGFADEAKAELSAAAERSGIRTADIGRGDVITAGGMSLRCLGPGRSQAGDKNERSLVLRLEYGNFSALLSGDVEGSGEDALISELSREKSKGMTTRVNVFKAAHHGSRGTNSSELLELLGPDISLISCGENNSYGHPHAEAVERMEKAGSRIFITKDHGAVGIWTDGNIVKIH